MSITYSPQIVGSLYVNAMEGHPLRIASSTTSSGGMYDEFTWSDRDFDMSQFWQKKQPMLHPAVPIENIFVPGHEMIERLLLNGINLQRSRMRIPQAVKLPALIRAYVAEPSLPLANMAMPRTKIAVHFAASLSLPPASFMLWPVQRPDFCRIFSSDIFASAFSPIIRPEEGRFVTRNW